MEYGPMGQHGHRLVLLTLLLIATGLAGCVDVEQEDPRLVIHVPHYRIGDRVAYEGDEREFAGPESWFDTYNWSALAENHSRTTDRYGIERPTIPFRIVGTYGDGIRNAHRCHLLERSLEAIRVDWEIHDWVRSDPLSEVLPAYEQEVSLDAQYPGSCWFPTRLSGLVLHEGEPLDPTLVAAEIWPGGFTVSSPGSPTTFAGRPALRYQLSGSEGDAQTLMNITIADGIPGFVEAEIGSIDAGWSFWFRDRLVGYAPGSGAEIVDHGARIPRHHPDAQPAPDDPLRFDDRPFRLDYPLAEAIQTLRDDPLLGYDVWFERHPDAVLIRAEYAHQVTNPESSWRLQYGDGPDYARFSTARSPLVDGLAGPPPVARNGVSYEHPAPAYQKPLVSRPETRVSTDVVAALVDRENPMEGDLVFFDYEARSLDGIDQHRYTVTHHNRSLEDTRFWRHRAIVVDATNGGLISTWDFESELEIGSIAAPPEIGAPSDPGPPALGAGTSMVLTAAAAGATAFFLIGLLWKLAVFLYTRLRQDPLLAHPVRTRLFEAIAAEPGVHREDLIRLSGAGNGATRHHLRRLAKAGLIYEMKTNGFVRYFATGQVSYQIAQREAILRSGRTRDVYELLEAEPGLTLKEAGRRLGMSAPSVHRIKQRLVRDGLLPTANAPLVTIRPAP